MHPCNFHSIGDGGKTQRGDSDNVFMYRRSCEPVIITDVLETTYA